MRSFRANIAVIGGSGLSSLLHKAELIRVGTPYGLPTPISVGRVSRKQVAFLARHGPRHTVPPHRVNYRANIFALHSLGVERIIATNAVGGINTDLKAGALVAPHDFIDLTRSRPVTFYDDAPVTHIDMSQPYCPTVRRVLTESAKRIGERCRNRAVFGCTEGPRLETPAEIRMLRNLGCDIVGMTTIPEVILARELEICYSPLCCVSNMAVGLQESQNINELRQTIKGREPVIQQILKDAIASLPKTRRCVCPNALKNARINGD